jgi:hypothetical protein
MVLTQIACLLQCIAEESAANPSAVDGFAERPNRVEVAAKQHSFNLGAFTMAGAKRRNPIKGPLITFALMIGSIVAVGAIAHIVDSKQKTAHSAPVVASESSQQVQSR